MEGGKTFTISAIKLWNSMPVSIRSSSSISTFQKNYRVFLLKQYAGLDHFNTS